MSSIWPKKWHSKPYNKIETRQRQSNTKNNDRPITVQSSINELNLINPNDETTTAISIAVE